MKPFSPDDALEANIKNLSATIRAVNELLSERFDGHSPVTILQRDIVERILAANPDLTEETIFAKGSLNIEKAYKSAGWEVEYFKPGFNESGSAYFFFEKRQPSQRD